MSQDDHPSQLTRQQRAAQPPGSSRSEHLMVGQAQGIPLADIQLWCRGNPAEGRHEFGWSGPGPFGAGICRKCGYQTYLKPV